MSAGIGRLSSLAHLETLLQLRDEHLKSVDWVEVLLLAQLLLLLLQGGGLLESRLSHRPARQLLLGGHLDAGQ